VERIRPALAVGEFSTALLEAGPMRVLVGTEALDAAKPMDGRPLEQLISGLRAAPSGNFSVDPVIWTWKDPIQAQRVSRMRKQKIGPGEVTLQCPGS